MRRALVAAAALTALVCGLCGMRGARANDRLTGIVLMDAGTGAVVVHHAAFAGMPAMTMTFRIAGAPRLHAGDRIRADVDRSREPWTLSNITLAGSQIPAAHPADAPFLSRGDRVPDVAFVDQTGHRFSLRRLAGAPYALTFAYTRCADPAMCPLVSAKLRAIARRTPAAVILVEVSLDPAYDRPPVLARYGRSYGADPARWHLLTGDPRAVLDFAARFGILERAAGPVTIVHSERLAIVGRDGRIARLYDGAAWAPSDVAHELTRGRTATPRAPDRRARCRPI